MGLTALVVDDDPAVRDMLDLVLGLEGFTVVGASDGVEGLEAARELRPDVIILDVMMPGLDGRTVATRLREDPELGDIPLVLCSALTSAEDTWAGWQTGADSYVSKPFDNQRLVGEILRAIAARRADAT